MRNFKVNAKVMAFVEVFAAFVILGIVFVGFTTDFPQMTTINEKSEKRQSIGDFVDTVPKVDAPVPADKRDPTPYNQMPGVEDSE